MESLVVKHNKMVEVNAGELKGFIAGGQTQQLVVDLTHKARPTFSLLGMSKSVVPAKHVKTCSELEGCVHPHPALCSA